VDRSRAEDAGEGDGEYQAGHEVHADVEHQNGAEQAAQLGEEDRALAHGQWPEVETIATVDQERLPLKGGQEPHDNEGPDQHEPACGVEVQRVAAHLRRSAEGRIGENVARQRQEAQDRGHGLRRRHTRGNRLDGREAPEEVAGERDVQAPVLPRRQRQRPEAPFTSPEHR
jgi:hypothetical protein